MGSALVSCGLPLWIIFGGRGGGEGVASAAIVAGSRSPLCLRESFGGQILATPGPLSVL